ncbi:hypothetical protein HQQ94_08175 [Shewanella sp. VB17]|uniref:hypothetical protein n=1 Tax=Shewanella sp. VB17 TaxID=2739432 RepID=UPI001565AE02|nr:hypothetical protein [Shewanella sp. VB17]NRD73219.1 hypothetical protein [Shewanella sp. VB17]
MRVPLRYHQPALQKLLIYSYVSGSMSYRARQRMAMLLQQIPELEVQLLRVETQFQALNTHSVQTSPKADIWRQIQVKLGWQTVRWWQKINYWRASSAVLACSLLLVMGGLVKSVSDAHSEYVPISYVGILNAPDSSASLAAAVHRATDAVDSPWMMTLHLTQAWTPLNQTASLWIRDNQDRKISMGQVKAKDTQQFLLTKAQWQFIQGAVWMELIADNSGRVILQGRCLALKSWS